MRHEEALLARYQADRIELYRARSEAPLLVQHAAADSRPFIHPIVSPDGAGVLTEDTPAHHPWQHGLYVGLNDVNGVGFWTEGLLPGHGPDGTFHPEPLEPPGIEANKAAWSVLARWRDPGGALMLSERQEWSFADNGDTYALDLTWTIAAEIDLTFGRYAYGGLFLRMPYRDALGGSAVSSEGLANGVAEGRRARWVAVSMPIDGRADWAGIALMDHRNNPEHPVPWRVDGSLGVGPGRCIAGAWKLKRGETARYKHRAFVYTGVADPARIETSFKEFNT
jgi:hypothetical protein